MELNRATLTLERCFVFLFVDFQGIVLSLSSERLPPSRRIFTIRRDTRSPMLTLYPHCRVYMKTVQKIKSQSNNLAFSRYNYGLIILDNCLTV